ncbi:hypothetical protein WME95_04080 [Sorangium sp. So ce327]|uniref:hypothetical protein n=1 Tax=Sorangium sp. So ce327 TaxID=3133301 RepID=UPI003F5FEB09
MIRMAHTALVYLPLALLLLPACGEATATASAEMALSEELGAAALVEEHDEGNVAWRIDGDGQVKAAIRASSGVRLKEDVGGTLVWKLPSGEARTIPLAINARTGLLVAAGPKLEADLTEISYTLTISGKPWSGVLHVPAGGTAELVASARVSAESKVSEVTVGPHGGSVQVVGDDRLEMVANEATGEVRVYVLDAHLKPVAIEGRTLKLGLVAERPEVLVLAPASAGFYFVGKLAAVVNPFRLTVALGFHGTTRVALWGYRPGVRVIATAARAPRVNILVKTFVDGPGVDVHAGARADVDVKVHDHDRGGDKVKIMVHDKDHGGGDKVKVMIHDKDHGGGGTKIMIHDKDHGGGNTKVMIHDKGHGGGNTKVMIHDKDHGGGGKANAHGSSGGAAKSGGAKGKR